MMGIGIGDVVSAMKSLVAATIAAVLVLVAAPAPSPVFAATPPPGVLPALQQWTPASSTGFSLSDAGRIVISTSALTRDARTFAADLSTVTATEPRPVVTGSPTDARPGDIFYGLDTSDGRLGDEGYRLTTGPVLSIYGATARGAFWGTRTAIQMLRQSSSLPAGSAIDKPKYPIRSVAMWAAVWKLGTWQNFVREMSYLKLNQLQLQSRFGGLSEQQMTQLRAVADQYHVTLTDTFSGIYGLWVPDPYELVRKDGTRVPDYLDISVPEAAAWSLSQVASFADSTTASSLHLAADEYPQHNVRANQVNDSNFPGLYARSKQHYPSSPTPVADEFIAMHNKLAELLKQRGKLMEIWSDNIFPTSTVKLNSDIVLDHWIDTGSTPAELAANGNKIVNADNTSLYFTEGWDGNTTPQKVWEAFDPGTFSGGGRLPGGANDPSLAGVKLAFWGRAQTSKPGAPQPMSAGALETLMLGLARSLAQKAWGSTPASSTWAAAQPVIQTIGRAPGVIATAGAGDPGASSLPGSPSLTYGTSQQLFRARSDGALLHSYRFPGSAAATTETLPVTAAITGRPTAYVTPGDQLHVFARGTNGHLQHTFWDGPTASWHHDDWTAAAAAGGSAELDIASDPAGFSYGNEKHVFARGSDGRLNHWWSSGDGKVHADVWAARFTGNPTAYAWGTTQNVVVRGASGSLQHWWWQPSDGDRPQHVNVGGSIASDASPTGMAYAETEQNIFARGADNHVKRWSYDPAAGSGFKLEDLTTPTGVSIVGNPTSFLYGNQKHLLFRGGDSGNLMHIWFSPGSAFLHNDWSAGASGVSVKPSGDPSSMMHYPNGEQHAFAPDSSGAMHHWWFTISDGVLRQDSWG